MLCEISFVTCRSELCIKSVFSCINPVVCIYLQYLLKALCSSFPQEASHNCYLVLPAAFSVWGRLTALSCTEVVVMEYISVASSLGGFLYIYGVDCVQHEMCMA